LYINLDGLNSVSSFEAYEIRKILINMAVHKLCKTLEFIA
jgi:hypothetical protein